MKYSIGFEFQFVKLLFEVKFIWKSNHQIEIPNSWVVCCHFNWGKAKDTHAVRLWFEGGSGGAFEPGRCKNGFLESIPSGKWWYFEIDIHAACGFAKHSSNRRPNWGMPAENQAYTYCFIIISNLRSALPRIRIHLIFPNVIKIL